MTPVALAPGAAPVQTAVIAAADSAAGGGAAAFLACLARAGGDGAAAEAGQAEAMEPDEGEVAAAETPDEPGPLAPAPWQDPRAAAGVLLAGGGGWSADTGSAGAEDIAEPLPATDATPDADAAAVSGSGMAAASAIVQHPPATDARGSVDGRAGQVHWPADPGSVSAPALAGAAVAADGRAATGAPTVALGVDLGAASAGAAVVSAAGPRGAAADPQAVAALAAGAPSAAEGLPRGPEPAAALQGAAPPAPDARSVRAATVPQQPAPVTQAVQTEAAPPALAVLGVPGPQDPPPEAGQPTLAAVPADRQPERPGLAGLRRPGTRYDAADRRAPAHEMAPALAPRRAAATTGGPTPPSAGMGAAFGTLSGAVAETTARQELPLAAAGGPTPPPAGAAAAFAALSGAGADATAQQEADRQEVPVAAAGGPPASAAGEVSVESVFPHASPGTDAVAGSRPALPSPPEAPAAGAARQVEQAVVEYRGAEARLLLDPEELGPVRLTVTLQDGATLIQIVAERPETAEMMRRHADLLLQDLADSGVASARLSFASGGDAGAGREGGRPTSPVPPQPAAAADAAAGQPGPERAARTSRGLDMRV